MLPFFFSCNNGNREQKGISTDLVNVPSSASEAGNEDVPVILFNEESHDFGKITQGEKVSYAFKFKNTGSADLIISSATGSCGCTVPHFPKDPISAGAEGVIDVVFDSENKSGSVKKTVTVVTNANPNTRMLTITTFVVVPEENKNKE